MSDNKELIKKLREDSNAMVEWKAADALEAADVEIARLRARVEVAEKMAAEVSFLLQWNEHTRAIAASYITSDLAVLLKTWEELQK